MNQAMESSSSYYWV